MDFHSRAATPAAETEGGSGSEQANASVEERPRRRLPSTLEGSAALSYADTGFFFVAVFFLAMMFRIGVHLNVFNQTRLDNPTLPFQITISLSLIGSLCAIIRLRHGRGVWTLLGWIWPSRIHFVAALLGGIGLGIGVDIIAHVTTPTTHVIHLWNLILLDGVARTNHRRVPFSWLLASGRCPHDWTDHGRLSHRCTLCHTPPDQHIRAMALLREHGDLDGSESNLDPPRHRL